MGDIVNMKITGTSITMADHGCLTFYVYLEGNGFGCCYGGYCIGHGYLGAKNFNGSSKGPEAMARIMDTVGVDTWEDLPGKYIRVVDAGLGRSITKIGNVIDDKWFDIKEFFEKDDKRMI